MRSAELVPYVSGTGHLRYGRTLRAVFPANERSFRRMYDLVTEGPTKRLRGAHLGRRPEGGGRPRSHRRPGSGWVRTNSAPPAPIVARACHQRVRLKAAWRHALCAVGPSGRARCRARGSLSTTTSRTAGDKAARRTPLSTRHCTVAAATGLDALAARQLSRRCPPRSSTSRGPEATGTLRCTRPTRASQRLTLWRPLSLRRTATRAA
jgi:hypothetical protein